MHTKQVIVMRTDLNMRKGKMIAQGAHASMKVFFDRIPEESKGIPEGFRGVDIPMHVDTPMMEWLSGSFTKVCVRVESEQDLDQVYQHAKELGLPCALIVDSGKTEFNGIPTKTCCAIGPAESDKINEVTGHLKLL